MAGSGAGQHGFVQESDLFGFLIVLRPSAERVSPVNLISFGAGANTLANDQILPDIRELRQIAWSRCQAFSYSCVRGSRWTKSFVEFLALCVFLKGRVIMV